ncbi:MAG TPA: long-chain N-acyl amino acid synthase [Rubrivivax sp.]|nr:long-chain N-acyl amino acid synthase [Burkholderiales bacterium]HNU10177.1 long-chain N-acyl amino acid synthase [Rubrivivax sp.]
MKKTNPVPWPQSTIIATPSLHHRGANAMLSADARIDLLREGQPGPRMFKIKQATSFAQRNSASRLLSDRYSWRGYGKAELPPDGVPNRISLSAIEEGETIGTLTVGLDGPEGLNADAAFSDLTNEIRRQGKTLCEFTKFAIDPISGTKRVLAALFHVAFIVAHRIHQCQIAVIEVNPRHVRYYERMLGFEIASDVRTNQNVKAPAVLLRGDLAYGFSQIEQFGGKLDTPEQGRSLYPYFFTIEEEIKIVVRLREAQQRRRAVVA